MEAEDARLLNSSNYIARLLNQRTLDMGQFTWAEIIDFAMYGFLTRGIVMVLDLEIHDKRMSRYTFIRPPVINRIIKLHQRRLEQIRHASLTH